jgi:hypothetical protein
MDEWMNDPTELRHRPPCYFWHYKYLFKKYPNKRPSTAFPFISKKNTYFIKIRRVYSASYPIGTRDYFPAG